MKTAVIDRTVYLRSKLDIKIQQLRRMSVVQ